MRSLSLLTANTASSNGYCHSDSRCIAPVSKRTWQPAIVGGERGTEQPQFGGEEGGICR